MPGCHTDCLERPLSNGFRQLGVLVARHPWWFLVISMLLSAGMGAGFYFYPQRLSVDMEDEFTPIEGPTKRDRDFIKQHFPTNDMGQFSVQRLYTEGTFASLIAVATSGNILTSSAFQEILHLDEVVQSLRVTWTHLGIMKNLTFVQLCARIGAGCVPVNCLLKEVNGNASVIKSLNFTYPLFRGREFLGSQLGGVQIQSTPPHTVQGAQAIRLVYYLKEDSAIDMDISSKWLEKYVDGITTAIKTLHFKSIQVKDPLFISKDMS